MEKFNIRFLSGYKLFDYNIHHAYVFCPGSVETDMHYENFNNNSVEAYRLTKRWRELT